MFANGYFFVSRGANPADPPSVKIARQTEVEAISSWLAAYEKNRYDNAST